MKWYKKKKYPKRWMWIPEAGYIHQVTTRALMKQFMDEIHEVDSDCNFVLPVPTFCRPDIHAGQVEGIKDILDYAQAINVKVKIMSAKTSKSVLTARESRDRMLFSSVKTHIPENLEYGDWEIDHWVDTTPHHFVVGNEIEVRQPVTGEFKDKERRLWIWLDNVPEKRWGEIRIDVFTSGINPNFAIKDIRFYVASPQIPGWYTNPWILDTYSKQNEDGTYRYIQQFNTYNSSKYLVYIRYEIDQIEKEEDRVGSIILKNIYFGDSPIMDDELDGGQTDVTKIKSMRAIQEAGEKYWYQILRNQGAAFWDGGFTSALCHHVVDERQIERQSIIYDLFKDYPAFDGLHRDEDEYRFGGWEEECNGRSMGEMHGELIKKCALHWKTLHDSDIQIFADMFDPNHNACKFYRGVNPNDVNDATRGGFLGAMDSFLSYGSYTNNVVFILWGSQHTAESEKWWSKKGVRILYGLSYGAYGVNDIIKFWANDRYVRVHSKCEGIVMFGWESLDILMADANMSRITSFLQKVKEQEMYKWFIPGFFRKRFK